MSVHIFVYLLQADLRVEARSSTPEVRPRFISRGDIPDNLAVNGARDTVLQLEVHLGNGVFREHRGVRDITCGLSAYCPLRGIVLPSGPFSVVLVFAEGLYTEIEPQDVGR